MQEGLIMDKTIKYTHRYLARFVIEAETPLAVGSGERDVMTDRLVATDVNGLPYIPGTALAGVLRNAFSATVYKETLINLFGYAEQDVKEENKGKKEQEKDKGKGSRLIHSSAQMVGHDGRVIDGLQPVDFSDEFYANFKTCPSASTCAFRIKVQPNSTVNSMSRWYTKAPDSASKWNWWETKTMKMTGPNFSMSLIILPFVLAAAQQRVWRHKSERREKRCSQINR